MSDKDREKGDHDATRDRYAPPRHSIIVPESEEAYQAVEERRNDYDEGWAVSKMNGVLPEPHPVGESAV